MKLFEFIANTLRKAFAPWRKKASRTAFKVIASGRGGVWPGVNLDNTSASLDIMDGIENQKSK
jgi:hypothetical protein